MRAAVDTQISAQLDASRCRWVTPHKVADWTGWVERTLAAGFGDHAPCVEVLQIHGVPATVWELLQTARGEDWLIADSELVATLAELRLLSVGSADRDSALDRMTLLIADGVRSCGNTRHYAACMGWLLQRSSEIVSLRRAATAAPAFSADAAVLLLHALASQVLHAHPEQTQVWRDLAAAAFGPVIAHMESPVREAAIQHAQGLGLDRRRAEAQAEAYLERLRSSAPLREELACDLVAALAFLDLRTHGHALAGPEQCPDGVSTKDVSDALFTAHGALQNLQLIAATQEIAATAADPRQRGVPTAPLLTLAARSSTLVQGLSHLLHQWCADGKLDDDLGKRIAGGEAHLQAAVDRRNKLRQRTVLEPLEQIDGILSDEQRFAAFEAEGLAYLGKVGVSLGDLGKLDSLRWTFTTLTPKDHP